MSAPRDKSANSSAAEAGSRPADGAVDEAERRQIQAILDQGDRDIAADSGRPWDEVKRRLRERCAAHLR